ncbi:MAG: Rne/Rng family ribonuclease [Bacteroidia bacterium]
MSRELVIQTTSHGADIALLEEKKLVELHHENVEDEFLVGDVYKGRVRKLLPGLNAAFIDIGHEKDAFLHYLDMGPNIRTQQKFFAQAANDAGVELANFEFEPEIQKTGKITDVLKPGLPIIVQIMKEPISTKGPRLSSQLSIAGRYVILIPFGKSMAISKKIRNKEERERLRRLLNSIRPANFSIIVRTVAEGKMVAELDRDLRNLVDKWDLLIKNLRQNKPKLLGELDKTESILRDLLNDSFQKVLVDNEQYYIQVKDYIQRIAPQKEHIVKLFTGEGSLYKSYGIDKQMKTLFGKIVNLTGGAYLIIEHTEAMHVIDVNSGSRRSNEKNQEDNALRINTEAAEEVARQLRLRDLGGIIIIDFIDMRQFENKKKLHAHLKELMKEDRAKHSVLPISKFGLVQITRQRVRPELNMNNAQTCPMCKGTGEANPHIMVVEEIENRLTEIMKEYKERSLRIIVNPFIQSHLTKGMVSLRWKWMWKYKIWIEVEADEAFFITKYLLLTSTGKEIEA